MNDDNGYHDRLLKNKALFLRRPSCAFFQVMTMRQMICNSLRLRPDRSDRSGDRTLASHSTAKRFPRDDFILHAVVDEQSRVCNGFYMIYMYMSIRIEESCDGSGLNTSENSKDSHP